MTMNAKIRRFLAKGLAPADIAKRLGISKTRVYTVRWKDAQKAEPTALKKAEPSKIEKAVTLTDDDIIVLFDRPTNADFVNHPPHYKAGGVETIDFIEAKDLNFRLGNAVKYISRAGKKPDIDPVEDLEKAVWYLKREIEARKGA